jgi:copper transport protein
VALVASGTVLAVIQLRRFDALWTTDYGLVLSAKLTAVLVLLALAAVNRYALTPRIADGDGAAARHLAGSTAAELLIALLALGLVAFWRFTPPPRALLANAVAPVHAHIHADKAMADIKIERAQSRQPTDHRDSARWPIRPISGQGGDASAREALSRN